MCLFPLFKTTDLVISYKFISYKIQPRNSLDRYLSIFNMCIFGSMLTDLLIYCFNTKLFSRNMFTDLLTWNKWETPFRESINKTALYCQLSQLMLYKRKLAPKIKPQPSWLRSSTIRLHNVLGFFRPKELFDLRWKSYQTYSNQYLYDEGHDYAMKKGTISSDHLAISILVFLLKPTFLLTNTSTIHITKQGRQKVRYRLSTFSKQELLETPFF